MDRRREKELENPQFSLLANPGLLPVLWPYLWPICFYGSEVYRDALWSQTQMLSKSIHTNPESVMHESVCQDIVLSRLLYYLFCVCVDLVLNFLMCRVSSVNPRTKTKDQSKSFPQSQMPRTIAMEKVKKNNSENVTEFVIAGVFAVGWCDASRWFAWNSCQSVEAKTYLSAFDWPNLYQWILKNPDFIRIAQGLCVIRSIPLESFIYLPLFTARSNLFLSQWLT